MTTTIKNVHVKSAANAVMTVTNTNAVTAEINASAPVKSAAVAKTANADVKQAVKA